MERYFHNTPEGGLLPAKLEDRDWDLLMRRINAGKCTPFLGAGAAYGVLPLGSQIAREWAEKFGYPLEDEENLARVATYLAVQFDPMYPKEMLLKSWFQNAKQPDYSNPEEPHAALAGLPLPIYMTTNYDPFMTKALEAAGKKPRRELCRWNYFLKDTPSIFDKDPGYEPSVQEPVVFHLHGHDGFAGAGAHRRRLPGLPGQHLQGRRAAPAPGAPFHGRHLAALRRL
jgi:hypothetical protein